MSTRAKQVETAVIRQQAFVESMDTQNLLMLGRKKGWRLHILGQAPIPVESIRLGDWLLVPAEKDTSPIPDRAWQRLQALFAAGIRPQGFVVVHEAPKLLPPPSGSEFADLQGLIRGAQFKSALKTVATVLSVVGGALAVVSGVIVIAILTVLAAAAVFTVGALIAGAIALDPILIAVMDDGTWIEIDRWDTY